MGVARSVEFDCKMRMGTVAYGTTNLYLLQLQLNVRTFTLCTWFHSLAIRNTLWKIEKHKFVKVIASARGKSFITRNSSAQGLF